MTNETIISILKKEYIVPGDKVTKVCAAIRQRHPDRVLAFIYYGSSLREMDNPDKMLDFYVIVDSYRKTHTNPLRALLNAIIPPAVYYHEMEHDDGVTTTCKYSIMSIKAFERRCSQSAFLSMTWGRFSQPCVILFPKDESIENRLLGARATAVKHIAKETAPLINEPTNAISFWARGFRESYRTELRPEKAEDRSEEIVARYAERYEALSDAIFGKANDGGLYQITSEISASSAKRRWLFRRLLGKPLGAVRILNSAFTFTGGFDYLQHKLKSHSGVTVEATDHQRRHPILWSPVLAWKYWRKGAFR